MLPNVYVAKTLIKNSRVSRRTVNVLIECGKVVGLITVAKVPENEHWLMVRVRVQCYSFQLSYLWPLGVLVQVHESE